MTAGANGQRERGDWVYRVGVGVGVGFIGAGVEMAGEETGRQDETHSRSVRETPERRSWPGGSIGRGESCTPVSGWGQAMTGHAGRSFGRSRQQTIRMAWMAYCPNEVYGQSRIGCRVGKLADEDAHPEEISAHAWSP